MLPGDAPDFSVQLLAFVVALFSSLFIIAGIGLSGIISIIIISILILTSGILILNLIIR